MMKSRRKGSLMQLRTSEFGALAVAAVGTLITLISFTMPLATVNPIAESLGADSAGRTWILSSMSVGLGVALLSAGVVADDYGRRRTFVAGALLLAAGSTAAAVAPSTLPFVIARVAQGVGGAALIASSLGLIAHTFPIGPARAAASGVWGAAVGGGIAFGPLMAAGLDHYTSWRDAYWIVTIVAIALAITAWQLVDESHADHSRGLDAVGTGLLAATMTTLLTALVEGRSGWARPVVLGLAAASVVLLALFLLVERHSRAAMLDLRLFTNPAFLAATCAAFTTGTGVIALMSYMYGFVGTALGISTLGAAWLLFAWSATSAVTALFARRIPLSGRWQLAVGLSAVGLGLLTLAGISTDTGWLRFLPSLLFIGVASGVVNAALGREAVASVPAGRGSLGSGANNTARYVGSAVGVTAVAAIASKPAGSTAAAVVAGWNQACLFTAVATLVGVLLILACRPRKELRRKAEIAASAPGRAHP
ncbi:MFS transporter [Nocardia testacea]|uniref:MFS transporter n=1 Tax=Nocardia testacea TaxID=248551 RepID=UPI0033C96691